MVDSGKKVDFDCLKNLYREHPAARMILDHLANRIRSPKTITVDRLHASIYKEGKEFSRGDVVSVFRELEKCGCGTFIAGRKGHLSRFECHVKMASVGRVAAGEIEQIEDVSHDEKNEEEIENFVKHTYRLRPEVEIIFELPIDLTNQEASRIARFIETLPFQDSNS